MEDGVEDLDFYGDSIRELPDDVRKQIDRDGSVRGNNPNKDRDDSIPSTLFKPKVGKGRHQTD